MPPAHHSFDCFISAGGVEEDLIKCMGKTYVGAFNLPGKDLRAKGQNRIGNMLVPNNNYCAFEEFMNPVLSEMLAEQNKHGTSWTPSKMIRRLGERIDNADSVYYWYAPRCYPCVASMTASLGTWCCCSATQHFGSAAIVVAAVRQRRHSCGRCVLVDIVW